MGILILRSSAAAAGGGGDWADVTVGFSGMPAELGGADGRKVRLDITGTDWGEWVDDINGASVTRDVGGAFDGTDAIKIVPPSSQLDNGNKTTYSCIMRGLDLTNNGAKDGAQVNFGFCIAYGSRYWDLGHTDKLNGIQSSQTIGGTVSGNSRTALFDAFMNPASDFRRAISVTSATAQSYHQPISGFATDSGPDADKLLILGSTSNEANDPPLITTQWMYFEQEVDYRQNRGNADGRNRLDVWTRNGYLGYLEIPLTHNSSWDFSYQYARYIEYLGALWNQPSTTADPDNCIFVSHPIVSLNRDKDDRIEPPPGFLL